MHRSFSDTEPMTPMLSPSLDRASISAALALAVGMRCYGRALPSMAIPSRCRFRAVLPKALSASGPKLNEISTQRLTIRERKRFAANISMLPTRWITKRVRRSPRLGPRHHLSGILGH